MNKLPTELVDIIYRMYFPWVMKELLDRQPQNNDFIVRTTRRSNLLVTEVNTHYGVLYLFDIQTSKLYRKGVPALPLELEQAYLLEQEDSSFPPGGGYVSSYIRNIANR
jgi:hypothetical protein